MHDAACRCCNGLLRPDMSRSGLGRRAFVGAAFAAAALSSSAAFAADPVAKTSLTPDQALKLLKEGNEEFRTEAPFRAGRNRERRIEIARGQAPFCVLIGCSDSRVPPELLFGRGLGELFIIRNAGNTIDTVALGSVEYGVGVLGCPLVVVLGHESCGAVAAAVEVVMKNATFPGVIGEMIQPILPAVLSVRGKPGDLLDNAVEANARRVAARLKSQSLVIQDAVRSNRAKVIAARYDLHNGTIDWYEDV